LTQQPHVENQCAERLTHVGDSQTAEIMIR
jgi:hypothetical protein